MSYWRVIVLRLKKGRYLKHYQQGTLSDSGFVKLNTYRCFKWDPPFGRVQTGLGKVAEIIEMWIERETRQPNGSRFGVLTSPGIAARNYSRSAWFFDDRREKRRGKNAAIKMGERAARGKRNRKKARIERRINFENSLFSYYPAASWRGIRPKIFAQSGKTANFLRVG